MKSKVKKPKSKVRKIIEWVGTIILGIVFLFAAVCNIAKLATRNQYGEGNTFGYSSYVVLTDSMDPVYPVDTAIITYKEKPEVILQKWNEIKDLNLDAKDEKNINITFMDAYKNPSPSGSSTYTDQTLATDAVMTHQLFNIKVDSNKEEGQGKYTFFVHGINISEHQSGANQYQAFTENELLGVVKMKSNFIGGISRFLSSVLGLIICLLIPCLYIVITSVLDIFKAYKDDEEELATEGTDGEVSGNKIENMSEKDYEKLKQEMINEMLKGKDENK